LEEGIAFATDKVGRLRKEINARLDEIKAASLAEMATAEKESESTASAVNGDLASTSLANGELASTSLANGEQATTSRKRQRTDTDLEEDDEASEASKKAGSDDGAHTHCVRGLLAFLTHTDISTSLPKWQKSKLPSITRFSWWRLIC
jgi:hypothetical protein